MEKAKPEMVPSTDFMLDDEVANKRKHDYLFAKKTKVIENTNNHIFYKAGTDNEGWYAGYDKRIELLYYLVQYESVQTFLGKAVTQTLIWRWGANMFAMGITEKVVFDILLNDFDTIMSDSHHTPDGKKFWITLLARAERRRLLVALINLKEKLIIRAERNEPIPLFLKRVSKEAWGDTENFQNMRFLISKKPI